MNQDKKPHPMDNPAMGELVEKLTTTLLDTLEAGKLDNWHDAVFAAGLAVNAIATIAATRSNGGVDAYKLHTAKVIASAMKQIIEPVRAPNQGKAVSLRRMPDAGGVN